jgi:hypothetical protein
MIYPSKPASFTEFEALVFDIETTNDLATILDIGFTNSMSYPKVDILGPTDFIEYLLYQRDFKVAYAHNGGRFDFILLLQYLEKSCNLKDVRILVSGSSSICWVLQTTDGFELTLVDSFFLLRSSLKKLTNSYPIDHKKDDITGTTPEQLRKKNYSDYVKYLTNDTLALFDLLKYFKVKIFKDFGIDKMPISAPSLGMKVFRRHLKRIIYTPKAPKLKAFERESLWGGLVVVKPGKYQVRCFDINSLYPTAMTSFKYPVSERGYWVKKRTKGAVGLYRVKIDRERFQKTSPVAHTMGNNIICGELLDFYSKFVPVYVEEGYEYLESDYIFNYMENLYTKRKEPGGELYKLLMNSTYGKFIEKEIGYEVALATKERIEQLFKDGVVFKDLGNFVSYPIQRKVPHQFCGMGSLILSRSKLIYAQYLTQIEEEDFVYGDTDSFHIRYPSTSYDNLTTLVWGGLGGLKLETPDTVTGIYLGKKLYSLENTKNGDIIIKAKGFTTVTAETFESAANSSEGELFHFTRFSTFKEGIRENGCKLVEVSKVLKSTA